MVYVTVMPVESDCLEEEAESQGGIHQQQYSLEEEECAQVESLIVSVCLDLPGNCAYSFISAEKDLEQEVERHLGALW